jgi:Ca2+-binding EF-hand superfamily protein
MTNMTKKVNITLLAAIIATTFAISPAMAGSGGMGGSGGNGGGMGNGGNGGGMGSNGNQDHQGNGGMNGRDRAIRMFERLDANDDGVLSLDEMTSPVPAKAEKMLNHKDTDEDGLLSLDEWQHGRRGAQMDLSDIADEIVQCVADIKEETGNEFIVVPNADDYKSPAERFADIDTSGDGFIDLAELETHKLAKVTDVFMTMDSDENGEVTVEEYKKVLKEHRATRRAVRKCVNELIDEEEG